MKMKKQIKPVSFWKPIAIKPARQTKIKPISFFRSKFTQPVNIKKYNSRTKRETRLIDRNPWGDKDRDGVVNWFDCKPLNRKKDVSKMLAAEIKQKFFDTYSGNISKKDFVKKIKSYNLRQIKRTTKGDNAYIIPINLKGPSRISKEFIEDVKNRQSSDAYGTAEEKAALAEAQLRGPFKIISEKELIHHIGKNPELINYIEKIPVELPNSRLGQQEFTLIQYENSPNNLYEKPTPTRLKAASGGMYSSSPFSSSEGKVTISRIHPQKKPVLSSIKHEFKHRKQDEEGYLYNVSRHEAELEAVAFDKAPTERDIATQEYKEKGPKPELLENIEKLSEQSPSEDIIEDLIEETPEEEEL